MVESVHKPHNLSAIVRTCDAVGIMRIHAVPSRDGLDLSRASAGGALKWVEVERHGDIVAAAEALAGAGFRIVAAHLDERAVDYQTVDYTVPTAFLMGTELDGLSETALAQAHQVVTVPMMGMVPSLNVSVATALLLYEARRQRSLKGMYDKPRLNEDVRDRILFEWGYPRLARKLKSLSQPYPALSPEGAIADPDVALMDTVG